VTPDCDERLERMENDLYRTNPDNPGAIIRLDRIEQLLSTMLKVGSILGGGVILWKTLEVVGGAIAHKVQNP
jgi:hypothetical protein